LFPSSQLHPPCFVVQLSPRSFAICHLPFAWIRISISSEWPTALAISILSTSSRLTIHEARFDISCSASKQLHLTHRDVSGGVSGPSIQTSRIFQLSIQALPRDPVTQSLYLTASQSPTSADSTEEHETLEHVERGG
jgi:hypothetical protein